MSDRYWVYKTGGIPDELFVRGQVPMTKSEVRAVTLAKARLLESHVVWDIGAGTGSVTVEAALTVTGGRVCAVEKEIDAIELIHKNIEQFGLGNVLVTRGAAPEALAGLPCPDRVIIGGSGGNFRKIAGHVYEKLPVGGRLVVNAVVLETMVDAVETMKKYDFTDVDITQVSISKAADLGRMHMWKSHNPVFVISGEKQ